MNSDIGEFIIAALVGSILSCLLTLLGVWFKYYLDHRPLQKQSLFLNPEIYPTHKSGSDNMISTLNTQNVDFDFGKGNPHREWVSVVYKFKQFGLLSKYDCFDCEVVFENGNFNQLDLEIKIPKPNRANGYDTIDTIKVYRPTDGSVDPVRIEVPFSKYSNSDVHNIAQFCFVVRKEYKCDINQECYGKYRLQNFALRKK